MKATEPRITRIFTDQNNKNEGLSVRSVKIRG